MLWLIISSGFQLKQSLWTYPSETDFIGELVRYTSVTKANRKARKEHPDAFIGTLVSIGASMRENTRARNICS